MFLLLKLEIINSFEDAKIQTSSYFTGNALFHPAYEEIAKNYKDPRNEFPVATKSTIDTFFLGVFPGLTTEQVDYMCNTIDRFFSNVKK
jgi:dTDP-4-amino-4,6-dideoxygalactose transaminase